MNKILIGFIALFSLQAFASSHFTPVQVSYEELVDSTAAAIAFQGGKVCSKIRAQIYSNINYYLINQQGIWKNDDVMLLRLGAPEEAEASRVSEWISNFAPGISSYDDGVVLFESKPTELKVHIYRVAVGLDKPLKCI